ncbi:MAG: hypothetical protein HYV07_27135 [Deltaproteobacteria bacterium]|nr:hypothetical protein [Deltaproteobacteria bacterium]
MRTLAILGALWLFTSCGDDPPSSVPCTVSTDCQLDEVCADGLCTTSLDRLRRDAGTALDGG